MKEIIQTLNEIKITEPIFREKQIEKLVLKALTKKFIVRSQLEQNKKRPDLIIEYKTKKIAVELKLKADLTIVKQLDKYMSEYRDGLVLVCYFSSPKFTEMFEKLKQKIKKPLELVILSRNQSII